LVASITSEVQEALGLAGNKLAAHLYKLLVYEKGSFFLPHRDGEKLDGMVATLVIALPSPHTGGELVVSHEGRRHEIALAGAAAGHELSYAAFYADCEHEVRSVKDGYRLCLSYNLTLARARAKKGITAPRTGAAVAAIGELLGHWPETGVQKLAVALDHQYSQEGLKIDTLKGVDRPRADVLFDAAEQAGCVAHLALITHWQSGSAEGGDYDYYSYRRRRRYGHWSDEDNEDDEQKKTGALSGYEMGEVYDEGLSIEHWSDREGKSVTLGEMDLNKEEIVANQPLEAWTISREEFEGYTGNAGMTLERWYHRAAIVVWPRKNHFQVLCGAGTDAAIAGLEQMVKKWKRSRRSDEERQRQSCVQFAGAIIDAWSPIRYQYPRPDRDRIDRSLFPRLLQELDAPELVRQFLAQVMPQDGGVQLDKPFLAFGRKHGWPIFAESLTGLMDGSSAETIARNAALLEILCLDRAKDAEHVGLCQRLAEHAVAALERLDGNAQTHDWRTRAIDRCELLTALVKALVAVEAEKPLARLINHTLVAGGKYDLTVVHLKAIFALEAWMVRKLKKPSRAISRWLEHCRTELEQRTARAPAPPADFRRADKLSCKCGDCRQLNQFLADPHQSVLRLPLAKDRRQHLHQVIEACGCDLTHVTTRKVRPYTLVCTKTTASYKKARQVYLRDCENLRRLQTIEERIERAPKG